MANFLRRLSIRKLRTTPTPTVKTHILDNTQISERSLPEEKPPPIISPDTLRTASNVLYFALRTLSSISSNIPFASVLSSIIDPLLDITMRIEQTSANAQGLVQLAARIELLTPIVSGMAKKNPNSGQTILEALQQELQSIMKDLEAARSQGKLNQFFHSTDTASSLQKHNMTLAQMIADSTFVTVHEVPQSVHELERPKSQEFSPSEIQIVLGDVTGGLGSPGCNALVGGEGGEGEGPKLDINPDERRKVCNISGGTGGTGGVGVEVGGKGGTGKAPVISVLRRSRVLVAEPQAEEEVSML